MRRDEAGLGRVREANCGAGASKDGQSWDGVGWDGMAWDGMGWRGMGRDGVGWGGMAWDGEGGREAEWNVKGRIGMGKVGIWTYVVRYL